MFLFPLLQCTCFYLAIGDNPKNLKIGVVNDELNHYMDCYNSSLITASIRNSTNEYETHFCDLYKISCRYLNEIPVEIAEQIHFTTYAAAYAEAKKANIIGFVHFAENFTEAINDIQINGRDANVGSFENGEISIRLDMSNQQVAYFLERKLREFFGDFAKKLMVDCGYPEALGTIPVHFEDPVYSTFDTEFKEYAAPGVVMT